MLMLISGLLGGLGLACVVSRKTLLGILVGIQLMVLGASMTFVLAGISSGARVSGHVVALFIVLGGVAQLVGGYALSVRLFYLKNKVEIHELRSLKR